MASSSSSSAQPTNRGRKIKQKASDNEEPSVTVTTVKIPPKSMRRKSSSSGPLLSKRERRQRLRLMYAGMAVVVAIAFKFLMDLMDDTHGSSSDTTSLTPSRPSSPEVRSFLQDFVCADHQGYCHPNIVPHGRTQRATRQISPPHRSIEKLVEIPRRLQIWDIDALRSPLLQDQLSRARHKHTGNQLDSGAFLAVYLCHRFLVLPRAIGKKDETDPLAVYFNILPTKEEVLSSFPILQLEEDLQKWIHPISSSLQVIRSYRDMIHSEYDAFITVSPTFEDAIPLVDYLYVRALVLSRSFGTGPQQLESEDERQLFLDKFGFDLSEGGRAMVPLLDMYNHHTHPNVEWRLDDRTESFIVFAATPSAAGSKYVGILEGAELMDSYGTYTDSHLFAKFGFVNGDGSGHTQASIASLHRLLDWGLGNQQFSYIPFQTNGTVIEVLAKQQMNILSRYLAWDDGYEECLAKPKPGDNNKAWELKRWKLKLLSRVSNNPKFWVVHVLPRNLTAIPFTDHDEPPTWATKAIPTFDYRKLEFDAKRVMTVCRIIALKEEDMDGNAIRGLQEAWSSLDEDLWGNSLHIDYQNDANEYRALMALIRLVGINLSRYEKEGMSIEREMARTERLNEESWGSLEWAAAHVNLGELQTLLAIRDMALSGAHQFRTKLVEEASKAVNDDDGRKVDITRPDAIQQLQPIRPRPCADEHLAPLVKDVLDSF